MRKTELENCPRWLLDAHTENENVSFSDSGDIIWHHGLWHNGEWKGLVWESGVWKNGIWRSGVWHNGVWEKGLWNAGLWKDGVWHDGTWCKGEHRNGIWESGIWVRGEWRNGTWHNGTWHDGEWYDGTWHNGMWLDGYWQKGLWIKGEDNRTLTMLFSQGIIFDLANEAIAYYSTHQDYQFNFASQNVHEGMCEFPEDKIWILGNDRAFGGFDVTTALRAIYVYQISEAPTKGIMLWKVRFKRDDILACSGRGVQIRKGIFERVDFSFLDRTFSKPTDQISLP